jgi:RNA polymerase II-associated factor 1
MSKEEEEEKQDLLAEVVDPMYMFLRADADADGEEDEGGDVPFKDSIG